MNGGSVDSSTSGRGAAVANRPTISFMSATPSRPTKSMQTSSRWAPSRVWARAISTHSSYRPAAMASRNALDPLALVGSPMARNVGSCWNGTGGYSEATPGPGWAPDPVHHGRDVLGGGAAAAADQGQAELAGEPLVRVGQLSRGER